MSMHADSIYTDFIDFGPDIELHTLPATVADSLEKQSGSDTITLLHATEGVGNLVDRGKAQ